MLKVERPGMGYGTNPGHGAKTEVYAETFQEIEGLKTMFPKQQIQVSLAHKDGYAFAWVESSLQGEVITINGTPQGAKENPNYQPFEKAAKSIRRVNNAPRIKMGAWAREYGFTKISWTENSITKKKWKKKGYKKELWKWENIGGVFRNCLFKTTEYVWSDFRGLNVTDSVLATNRYREIRLLVNNKTNMKNVEIYDNPYNASDICNGLQVIFNKDTRKKVYMEPNQSFSIDNGEVIRGKEK